MQSLDRIRHQFSSQCTAIKDGLHLMSVTSASLNLGIWVQIYGRIYAQTPSVENPDAKYAIMTVTV